MRRLFICSIIGLTAAFGVACGESADETNNQSESPFGENDGDGENEEGNQRIEGGFALASTVLGENSNTTYVRRLDELEAGEVSLENAREYPGYATIGAVDGMFFVGNGETPEITRFVMDGDNTLEKDGSVNFGQYVGESPLYANTFGTSTSAYLDMEDSGHVVWNPEEMTIEETRTLDDIPDTREELPVFQSFRRGTVVHDGKVFQPFHWRGENYYDFAADSHIAVFDAESGDVEKVLEAPCPGLDVGTKDADGNIYFTNWVNATAAPVIDGESNSHDTCAVKIDAGTTELNGDWTRDLAEMTDGREVAAVRILEGSTALAAVLDHERVDQADEVEQSTITRGQNWELWRLDLEEGTGSKVGGTDYIAGGYYAFRLDGRMVVLLPTADYSETTAWEIPVDGEARELFTIEGWVYQMVEFE